MELIVTVALLGNNPSFVSTFKECNESEPFNNALESIGDMPITAIKKNTKFLDSGKIEVPTRLSYQFTKEEAKSKRATESIAERARKLSQSKITKLKKTLSMDDLMRHVSGVNNNGYDTDSTDADISVE